MYVSVQVKEVSGDAQTIASRGRLKHVCDLSLTLLWRVDSSDNSIPAAEGSLQLQDLSADGDYEATVCPRGPPASETLLTRLRAAVDVFLREFKAKY